jgi:hypothetical protein
VGSIRGQGAAPLGYVWSAATCDSRPLGYYPGMPDQPEPIASDSNPADRAEPRWLLPALAIAALGDAAPHAVRLARLLVRHT